MRLTPTGTLSTIALLGVAAVGCSQAEAERRAAENAQAVAQVEALAARIRSNTTDTASYVKIAPDEVTERDPWGRQLSLIYTDGGMSESFEVRSLGPDGRMHSADDIIATGFLMNFKGVGRAIRAGAEETAANSAKGVVKGAFEGAKESVAEGVSEAGEKFSIAAGKLKEKLGRKSAETQGDEVASSGDE